MTFRWPFVVCVLTCLLFATRAKAQGVVYVPYSSYYSPSWYCGPSTILYEPQTSFRCKCQIPEEIPAPIPQAYRSGEGYTMVERRDGTIIAIDADTAQLWRFDENAGIWARVGAPIEINPRLPR